MNIDGLRVNHAGLDQAAQDLYTAVKEIDDRMNRLESELAPLRSDWTGQAQQAAGAAVSAGAFVPQPQESPFARRSWALQRVGSGRREISSCPSVSVTSSIECSAAGRSPKAAKSAPGKPPGPPAPTPSKPKRS